jgi:hypothetical protein
MSAGLPDLLRAIAPTERILVALRAGPMTKAELAARVGVPGLRLWRLLDALRHAGRIQCIGYRNAATWALAGEAHEARRPVSVSIKPRRGKVVAPPADPVITGSWWITAPRAHFQDIARHRAAHQRSTDD